VTQHTSTELVWHETIGIIVGLAGVVKLLVEGMSPSSVGKLSSDF